MDNSSKDRREWFLEPLSEYLGKRVIDETETRKKNGAVIKRRVLLLAVTVSCTGVQGSVVVDWVVVVA